MTSANFTVEQTRVAINATPETYDDLNCNLSQQLLMQKSTASNLINIGNGKIVTELLSPQKPTLKSVLSLKEFRHFIFWFLLTFMGMYIRTTFISAYGAAYFAGCHSRQSNLHCDKGFNWDTYNIVMQISNSCAGCLAFLSASFIGKLSDKYGRKPFLYLLVCLLWTPYIFILFSNNMLIFIGLLPLVGLCGSITINGPVTNAYIADIFTEDKRLYAFGVTYFLAGVGLLLGTLVGFAVAHFFDDFYVFYVINGALFFALIYLRFFIKESLDKRNRSLLELSNKRNYSPCESIKYLYQNKVVLYVSIVSAFFSSLPETGFYISIAKIFLCFFKYFSCS